MVDSLHPTFWCGLLSSKVRERMLFALRWAGILSLALISLGVRADGVVNKIPTTTFTTYCYVNQNGCVGNTTPRQPSQAAACSYSAVSFTWAHAGNSASSQVLPPSTCRVFKTWWDGTTGSNDWGISSWPDQACPEYSTVLPSGQCKCDMGFAPNSSLSGCVPRFDMARANKPRDTCSNPQGPNALQPLSGSERKEIRLGIALSGQEITLTYDSSRKVDAAMPGMDPMLGDDGAFGVLWFSSLHRRLSLAPGGIAARVSRGDGYTVSFSRSGSLFVADADEDSQLVQVGGGYRYTDLRANATEMYDAGGLLYRIEYSNGRTLDFVYSDSATPASVAPGPGFLLQVQDLFGRTVKFEYDGAGRVIKLIDPRGALIVPQYLGGNLTELLWQDGARRVFTYTNGTLPWALTGITDERNMPHASLSYDSAGRATSSALADSADSYAVGYSAGPLISISDQYMPNENIVVRNRAWTNPQGVAVTTASGATYGVTSETILGVNRLRTNTQPPGSGCGASTSEQAYDPRGNIASRDDFNGNRQCFAYESARNLETVRVEGLSVGASCGPVIQAGATLTIGTRKVSSAWHPIWRLRERVAEPRRITTYVYNGRPDPYANQAVAACAPSNVLAVCKQVVQATVDETGADGFAAAAEPNVALRVESWTYNADGQVLTHDGPLPGAADTTTYTYYTGTSFSGADPNAVGVTRGDLQTVTNPAGLVTEYLQYNKSGKPIQVRDANLVVTTNGYDQRDRLTSTVIAGQTTQHEYWPTGLLKKTTRPDLSWILYEYDAAHRLKEVMDNLGNKIEYELDAVGNRHQERSKDPTGALRRYLQRDKDALGRIERITGRSQ